MRGRLMMWVCIQTKHGSPVISRSPPIRFCSTGPPPHARATACCYCFAPLGNAWYKEDTTGRRYCSPEHARADGRDV